jgi:hypothetical protein
MMRRLPLLLIALVGVWLWQAGARERQIIWRLPFERVDVEQVEIQLRTEDGELIERRINYAPVPAELTQKVSLAEGRYLAQLFIQRRGKEAQVLQIPVEVTGEVVMPTVPSPR